MEPFEALYGKRCRSSFLLFDVGESAILGFEIVHEAKEKVRIIRDRFSTAYSFQKSYAYNRQRALEFERVGNVTYELKLPEDLASVHRVFHVSMLKKCLGDPASSLLVEGLGVNEKLSMKRFNLKY
ncbi:uncharacterized protein [Solanum lycopersicum]|uniref:uncharacterized protein n=1 Tax=Solanum lycopersicum TaxID=4081 RepID=UPI0002BCA638